MMNPRKTAELGARPFALIVFRQFDIAFELVVIHSEVPLFIWLAKKNGEHLLVTECLSPNKWVLSD